MLIARRSGVGSRYSCSCRDAVPLVDARAGDRKDLPQDAGTAGELVLSSPRLRRQSRSLEALWAGGVPAHGRYCRHTLDASFGSSIESSMSPVRPKWVLSLQIEERIG